MLEAVNSASPDGPLAGPKAQPASSQVVPPATGVSPKVVKRIRIGLIKRHPLQDQTFDPPTEAELRLLADNMDRYGQHDPVQLMPAGNAAGLTPGTLLDGHSRVAAAEVLGWTHIDAVIRHDLKDASAAEVEGVYLLFNFNRRQLDPLEQARIARRLYEIERKRPPGKLRPGEARDARDRVGQMAKPPISGRTLDRHWNILAAPLEVQRAYRAGRLKVTLAERVGRLCGAAQAEVVEAIAGAGDGKVDAAVAAVVRRYPGESRATPKGVAPAAVRWLTQAARGLDGWEAQASKAHGPTMAPHRDTLLRIRAVAQALITASRKPQAALPRGLLKAAAAVATGQPVRR